MGWGGVGGWVGCGRMGERHVGNNNVGVEIVRRQWNRTVTLVMTMANDFDDVSNVNNSEDCDHYYPDCQ